MNIDKLQKIVDTAENCVILRVMQKFTVNDNVTLEC